jgi:hypothetical protein
MRATFSPPCTVRASPSGRLPPSTGLIPQRLYLWRRRLGGAELTTFQELVVRPVAARASPEVGGFEIVLASGDVVRVPPSFDSAALARLLEVVAQVRAC